MIDPEEECGAPWCNTKTARARGNPSRSINGIQICASCHFRTWYTAKRLKKTMKEVFPHHVGPPRKIIISSVNDCAREACTTEVSKKNFREIKNEDLTKKFVVCGNCYLATCRIMNSEDCSMYEAFLMLPPKYKRRNKSRRQNVVPTDIHLDSSCKPQLAETFTPAPLPDPSTETCPSVDCETSIPLGSPEMRRSIGFGQKQFFVCCSCHRSVTLESDRYGISMTEAWQSLQEADSLPEL